MLLLRAGDHLGAGHRLESSLRRPHREIQAAWNVKEALRAVCPRPGHRPDRPAAAARLRVRRGHARNLTAARHDQHLVETHRSVHHHCSHNARTEAAKHDGQNTSNEPAGATAARRTTKPYPATQRPANTAAPRRTQQGYGLTARMTDNRDRQFPEQVLQSARRPHLDLSHGVVVPGDLHPVQSFVQHRFPPKVSAARSAGFTNPARGESPIRLRIACPPPIRLPDDDARLRTRVPAPAVRPPDSANRRPRQFCE